jgi:hypothetical protein
LIEEFKLKKLTALLITLLLITGCATSTPGVDPNDKAAVTAGITTFRDNFKKVTHYQAPEIHFRDDGFDRVSIRSWKIDIDTDEPPYQIYVSTTRGQWIFFDTTYDSNGTKLETRVIEREVGYCDQYGCRLNEAIGINITRDYLEKSAATGISFQISGSGGKAAYTIPPAYIQAFLSSVKP